MYKKAKYFISENNIIDTEQFNIKELEKGFSVYEVVKIIKGIPLFFEDHINRLHQSAILKNKKIPFSDYEISKQVFSLIKINQIYEGRLKFVVRFYKNENKLISFYLNPIKPTENDYKNGIEIQTFKAERQNPNAKVINYNLRTSVNKLIRENNIFEVLLYNEKEIISECSKSNIFFVKNNILYTSLSENVLPGITRSYIYKICKELSTEITEKKITVSELQNFESAFITGTSIGVLPVKQIDTVNFDAANILISELSKKYQTTVSRYLSDKLKRSI